MLCVEDVVVARHAESGNPMDVGEPMNFRTTGEMPDLVMTIVSNFAAAKNAAVITDKDGDIAVQGRHYSADGRKVVRHAPDRCHFHPPTKWQAALDAGTAADLIC